MQFGICYVVFVIGFVYSSKIVVSSRAGLPKWIMLLRALTVWRSQLLEDIGNRSICLDWDSYENSRTASLRLQDC